jgi:hypothetical protein
MYTMTVTYTIRQVGGTYADYTMPKLSESSFIETQIVDLPNGGSRRTYKIGSGDNTTPATFVVQSKPNENGNGGTGTNNVLIAFNTYADATDSVTGEILTSPISAVLTINVPLTFPIEVADLRNLVENLYAFTYDTLTSKVPDTARLSKLALFGGTQFL